MCVCMGRVCVSGGWGAITPVMGKRRRANLKYRTLKRHKIGRSGGMVETERGVREGGKQG